MSDWQVVLLAGGGFLILMHAISEQCTRICVVITVLVMLMEMAPARPSQEGT